MLEIQSNQRVEHNHRYKFSGMQVARIIFKSCKYNHSPNYMSSIDGAERESNKQLFEGEKEKTHALILIKPEEAELILEERQSGVSIGEIVSYLNNWLRNYLRSQDLKANFKILYGIVPSEPFLDSLRSMQRVTVAEVFTHKRLIGSEGLNLLNREDPGMHDDIVVSLKSKRSESMSKRAIKGLYDAVVGTDENIKRVRVYGKANDGLSVKLDTEVIKKTDYVNAQLDQRGIVDSGTLFARMEEILFGEDIE